MAQKYPLFILCILICVTSIAAHAQLPDSVTSKLKKAISDFKAKYPSPSVAVVVIQGKQIVYEEASGYSDMETRVEVTIDSKYPIMSITKMFTATMLMQLVEKKLVTLNDDVRKYIAEYKVRSDFPGTTSTTLLQLATHASGLPRNSPADIAFTVSLDKWLLGGQKDSIQPFATNAEVLNSLRFLKLDYPPYHFVHHNDRHYSNLGYTLLGIALERAARQNYSDYVITRICKPLKMSSTGFITEAGIKEKIATGYRYNKIKKQFEQVPFFEVNAGIYAGGLYSTARDMALFISSQFEENSVLAADSRAMMRSLKIGWKPAYPFVLHEGAFPGHRSIIVFNPESKIGWVILSNAGDMDFNQINGQFAEIMSAAFNKPGNQRLEKYCGAYSLPGGYGKLEVSLKNDTLYSTYLQDLLPGRAMIPEGSSRFRVDGKDGYNVNYQFVENEQSQITGVRMGQLLWSKD